MSKSKKCINCGRFLNCDKADESYTKDTYCDRYIKADREIRRIKMELLALMKIISIMGLTYWIVSLMMIPITKRLEVNMFGGLILLIIPLMYIMIA